MLREAFLDSVTPNGGFARVQRTMQLAEPVPASAHPIDFAPISLTAGSDASAPAPEPSTLEQFLSVSPPSEFAKLALDVEEHDALDVVEDPAMWVAAENMFVVVDVADEFGAIKVGHNAFFQGEIAACNVRRLAAQPEALEKYAPGGRAIKISLGRVSLREVVRRGTETDGVRVCRRSAWTSSRVRVFGKYPVTDEHPLAMCDVINVMRKLPRVRAFSVEYVRLAFPRPTNVSTLSAG